mmetsp:Transcript_13915/g.24386  ORF Transcript_13915/g.24386 Transcript_13915/m.24386 type:complete len:255 (-) Transcript_13915:1250-2014(-)|eukprot:CAMPEP_0119109048 /NCGR_PEP_ID=MMETSP1180-20130426/16948_1 /TAXON_ID=3052 ORGANISM="Chlamydomonas cf sp, Strain CCMP681" /NCGR_SAMPLE_ID=MMETSP1180 /ASSEMBLY_ACC=CAM_ASM_000741 /LENGTH=254 /DNA_ID=CAMNT_0007094747 /DNA_START=62 /DNA_END=826 /DNA_ORIENTATION=+
MVQLMVRGARGPNTLCLEVQLSHTVAQLKANIQSCTGIPEEYMGLVFSGKQLQDEEPLEDYAVRAGSSVQLVYRLLGGKGGFGALLRGAARDGKGTANFDACRDLSGRRVRHQTAELKLEEWKSQAQERDLEKVAMQHIKDQARQKKKEIKDDVDIEAIRKAQSDTLARTQAAVQDVLRSMPSKVSGHTKSAPAAGTSSSEGSDRAASTGSAGESTAVVGQKRRSPQKLAAPAKRSKMMAALDDVSSCDSEDSD